MTEEEYLRLRMDMIYDNSVYGLYKEDNEMKATSVHNIKNVKDVCFDISNDPIKMESKLTIVASTDDDIFAFEFEGSDILQSCKRAGLFTGWEKDQKIRELEAKNKDMSDDNALLLETNKKLKEENEELKKKNEALVRENEKNIKRFDCLNRKFNRVMNPSSRADILDLAKKCVCGQREQDYGTPESNFQLIADLWNDYLKKERSSIVVDAMDVSMMMALMKIARIRNGGGSGDSFVDLAGYAACGGEIWHSNKETNGDSSQETN